MGRINYFKKQPRIWVTVKMTRVLAYLTLIPTLFTFIAIVLINVGGVNPSLGAGFSSMREENSAFGLLKVFLIYNFLF